uniref:Uncharacterized protein n=1 Tax=virus sp. ctBM815 TaxID=2825806 RepID=A0A8S5RKH5_9VIRU|nr:MAG TPA: hypothetical protein [virus sp. ctBM815]
MSQQLIECRHKPLFLFYANIHLSLRKHHSSYT